MNRRALLARAGVLGGLPLLVGCTPAERAALRFRAILKVLVDGKPMEGSTVMEVSYSRVTKSLSGSGGGSRHQGEALILDMPGKGTLFMLPYRHYQKTSLSQIFEEGLLDSLGIERSIGTLEDQDFAVLRAAKGRIPFHLGRKNKPTSLPAFIAFRDEKDPKTIYEVEPENFGATFPGVRFVGLDIEFTDAPLTHELRKRLPWLEIPGTHFPRFPAGDPTPDAKLPISHKITRSHFFGAGN